MCRFTIATLECGHPQEDHVDTYGCVYFQRSNLHCDRDNPNYKDRFTIRTTDREGICNRCLSVARKREEEAIEREQRKYDEQRRREAKEREEELRRGEREVLEKGHRQAEEERQAERRRREEAQRAQERQRRASDERIREIERKSREEYDRQIQNQMERDMEYMMKKSREEAERREREEEEEIQRALAESARLIQSERSSRDESPASGSRDLSEGRIESWIESMSRTTTTTTITHNHNQSSHNNNTSYNQTSASPPSPPATPPTRKASSPPPPPPLPIAAPKSPVNKSTSRPPPPPPPAPKPAGQVKEINYSLPAVGDQKIGRFRLGSRAVPIHESQDIPETPITPAKPLTPSSPAPFVRLGGAIPASDVPIVREIKGQVMPVDSTTARTGPPLLRKQSDSTNTMPVRKGPPPPVPDRSGKDPQLEAMLAKRRAWEPEEDEGAITPPRSPGKGGVVEDKARRLTAVEFDSKRKMGWKKDEDED